jgi:cyclopropane fatty-acyl-phospholipid synthase-like methyltransferase
MTLLDIGCAQGAFSFEAERRGATVVASDSNPSRLVNARQFSDMLGSKVKFTNQDFLSKTVEGSFDFVLALNVLHHVKEPQDAIKRAAALAKKYLVLEFPNSKDPLYQDKKMKNLVGPYLFEEISLFGDVKLIPSPKDERIIAICSKKGGDAWPLTPQNLRKRTGIPRHEEF